MIRQFISIDFRPFLSLPQREAEATERGEEGKAEDAEGRETEVAPERDAMCNVHLKIKHRDPLWHSSYMSVIMSYMFLVMHTTISPTPI